METLSTAMLSQQILEIVQEKWNQIVPFFLFLFKLELSFIVYIIKFDSIKYINSMFSKNALLIRQNIKLTLQKSRNISQNGYFIAAKKKLFVIGLMV